MRWSIGIAMKRSLWLFAAALVAYGTPAFGQTLADYDAAIVTAQAELDTATAAFETAQTARDTAQAAVDTAKATRDELKAARDLIDRETAEWKAAHKKFKEAADAVWDAREVRDAASHTVGMTRIAKLQAETAHQNAVDARVAYLESPAGQQERIIAALEDRIADLEAERDTLTTALQAANADNQTIQKQLDLVTTVLDIAMEDLLQAAEKLTTLKDEAEEKQAEIEELQADYADMSDLFDDVMAGCAPFKDDTGAWTVNTDTVRCVPMDVMFVESCYNPNNPLLPRYPDSKITIIGTDLTDMKVLSGAPKVPFAYFTHIPFSLTPRSSYDVGLNSVHRPHHIVMEGLSHGNLRFSLEHFDNSFISFNSVTMDFVDTDLGEAPNIEELRGDLEKLVNNLLLVLDGRADELPTIPMCDE